MDLRFLAPAYEADGPFATVYLDTTRVHEDAAHMIAVRWGELRQELAGQGAPDAVLEALDTRVGEDRGVPGPHGQVVVAAGDGVVLDRVLPAPPRRQGAHWAALPHLMPYVAQLGETVPHVLAVVDHLGADVTAYGPLGEDDETRDAETRTVEGETLHHRKVKPGDWAHKQYQRRAENLWEQNAAEVAAQVDSLVATTGAGLLVVAGEARARRALAGHLSGRSTQVLAEVEHGSRSDAGAGEEKMHREVERLVAEHAARRALDAAERFAAERGRGGAATDGLAGTIEALRRAQVDTLLVADDPSATTRAWVGGDPLLLGARREDLTALGVERPVEDRADAALVRAVAGSDAALVVVPGPVEMADGVGALLRWSDA
jgi:hypothetical protein